MRSEPPHLLTLPREVRNNIYNHLYRAVKIPWRFETTIARRRESHDLEIQVDNFPLIGVLLTCHRLHNEYLESLDHLSISIRFPQPTSVPFQQSEQKRTIKTLSRARHVTLFMVSEEPLETEFSYWTYFELFTNALTAEAPSLSTFRTVMLDGPRDTYSQEEIVGDKFEPDLSEDVFYPPPETLSGLSLANHAQLFLSKEGVICRENCDKAEGMPLRRAQLCMWARGPAEKNFFYKTDLLDECRGLSILRYWDIFGKDLLK